MKVKQQRPQKYKTREYNRCKLCGRPHAYIRKYGICRICFRELANKGEIPGVKKASWQGLALRECNQLIEITQGSEANDALICRLAELQKEKEKTKKGGQ